MKLAIIQLYLKFSCYSTVPSLVFILKVQAMGSDLEFEDKQRFYDSRIYTQFVMRRLTTINYTAM